MATINGYSNYMAAGLQNYGMATGGGTYAPPVASDICVGLCLQSLPFPTGFEPGVTATSEPFGKLGYNRAPAPSGSGGHWSTSAKVDVTEINNTQQIAFPVSGESWGEVYYFGVFDNSAESLGQLLWGAALTTHKLIDSDTVAVFTIGSLVLKSRNT